MFIQECDWACCCIFELLVWSLRERSLVLVRVYEYLALLVLSFQLGESDESDLISPCIHTRWDGRGFRIIAINKNLSLLMLDAWCGGLSKRSFGVYNYSFIPAKSLPLSSNLSQSANKQQCRKRNLVKPKAIYQADFATVLTECWTTREHCGYGVCRLCMLINGTDDQLQYGHYSHLTQMIQLVTHTGPYLGTWLRCDRRLLDWTNRTMCDMEFWARVCFCAFLRDVREVFGWR